MNNESNNESLCESFVVMNENERKFFFCWIRENNDDDDITFSIHPSHQHKGRLPQ